MPFSTGSMEPTVKPNEWNIGRKFSTTSCGLKLITDSSCFRLPRIFAYDSTTPFGVPSEPDVNSTTAGCSGSM